MNTSLHSFKDERILCIADIRGKKKKKNSMIESIYWIIVARQSFTAQSTCG